MQTGKSQILDLLRTRGDDAAAERADDGSPLHGSELVAELKSAGWKVLIVSGSLDQAGTAAAIAAAGSPAQAPMPTSRRSGSGAAARPRGRSARRAVSMARP